MILQRYILRELVVGWLFTFVTLMAVSIIGMLMQLFRSFEGGGLELLAQTLPIAMGYMAPWVLVVATCTAATLAYGRLAAENELDAMRLSGIHANRILAPAVLFGLALGGANYLIHDYVAPWAHWNLRIKNTEAARVLLKLPPPGRQRIRVGAYTLNYLDYKDGRMQDPHIHFRDVVKQQEMEFRATSGQIVLEEDKVVVVMSKPSVIQRDPNGERQILAEGDVPVPMPLVDPTKGQKDADDLHSWEIPDYAARTPVRSRRQKAWTAYYTRYAQASVPLLLTLVSVAIGVLVKRGSRLAGLGAALPPILVYFVLFFVFRAMGEKGRVPPVAAALAPPAVLAALAAGLLRGVYRK